MKLYKITAIISFFVLAVCLLCSLLIPTENNSGFLLLQNYAVGIACSIIVVIITTLLQFNYEQTKAKNEVISEIRTLFLYYYLSILSAFPNENTSQQIWNHFYERIEASINAILSCLSNLDWFSKKNQNNANNIHFALLQLKIEIYKNNSKKENAIKSIFEHSSFNCIKEMALIYVKNDYDKKLL